MKSAWIVPGLVAALAPMLIAGCHDDDRPRKVVVVHERPVVVHERPVTVVREEPPPVIVQEPARPAEVIVVQQAPPAQVVEVQPAPPVVGYVWIGGYWNWHGPDHRYVWVHGHYAPPPHHGAVWVRDRWEHEGHGYRYHPGHWR